MPHFVGGKTFNFILVLVSFYIYLTIFPGWVNQKYNKSQRNVSILVNVVRKLPKGLFAFTGRREMHKRSHTSP